MMSSKFVNRWKSEFWKELKRMVKSIYGLIYIRNITEEWNNNERETWEYVYAIYTKNSDVIILVWSSLDIMTDRFRPCGSDAVRIVVYKRENGVIKKALPSRRNRVENLFPHMEETLKKIASNLRNPDGICLDVDNEKSCQWLWKEESSI